MTLLARGIGVALLVGALVLPCRTAADDSFDYFRNSWAVIGLKDYVHGTRISPENELLIGPRDGQSEAKADRVAVGIRFGRQRTPLSRVQTKRLLDGWLPIVLISANDSWVRYELTLWATPLPSVKDWQKAFDWPTEGENFLNWIMVRVTNTGGHQAEANLSVEQYRRGEKGGKPVLAAAAPREFTWSLSSGASAECVVRIPWAAVAEEGAFDGEDPKVWLDRTAQYWRGILADAAQVDVPCLKAGQALLAAHVCQLIASDHGELHGGEGFYDEFYLRDGAYQILELEEAGLWDAARQAIGSFLSHQREDGRFESQKNQYDANGQTLWALWQYYKITGDVDWLAHAYPRMRRAVDWTMQARRQCPAESPFAGLLPNAPADGEYLWNGDYHIVGYDFWNLRGLLCTAEAAGVLGKTQEAETLRREAAEYQVAIDAAWKRTGVAHFPPSWEKAGTHWGNTETLWPTEIFPNDDPRVGALVDEVRVHHGGGFLEGSIRWLGGTDWRPPLAAGDAIHPYMSAYTTMASLARGEHEKVVEEFYWYLLHSTATHGFPEGIFHKRRFAWSDTIPHVTGASNYAILLRHMLVHERGDELHLLAAVPDGWLADGRAIRLVRAPTHFGEMSLHVRGVSSGVEAEIDLPKRQLLRRVVLHLPESRPLVRSVQGVEVAVRSTQKAPWDFPAVVARYGKQAVPLLPETAD